MASAALPKSQIQDEALLKTRRRQIFLAACRVLARKSFHEATVKEIALEAGVAAGSIYVYLKSKDDILYLLAESMVGELVAMLPEIRARAAGDPRRELVEVTRAIIDVIDRYREAFAVLHHEVRYLVRRREYRDALGHVTEQYQAAVADSLLRGKQCGLLQFQNLRSVVEAIHMLCAGWATGAHYLKNVDKETYWREIVALIEGRFFTANASAASEGTTSAAS